MLTLGHNYILFTSQAGSIFTYKIGSQAYLIPIRIKYQLKLQRLYPHLNQGVGRPIKPSMEALPSLRPYSVR